MKILSDNSGTALVLTLLVIAALTTMTVAFSHDTGIELNLVGYSRDSHMAHQMATSGVNIAMAFIDQDEDKDVDSLDETWAKFNEDIIPLKIEEDSTLKSHISDENSKLNLNKLLDENGEISDENEKRLKRLFSALGIAESYADPILDWLDIDDTERMEGAEDIYYQSLDTPYHFMNTPFLTISQLRLIKGVADIIKTLDKNDKNLFDYVTIYGDGKININTASSEILQSLHEQITEDIAQAIVDDRQEDIFLEIYDLTRIGGIDQGEGGLFDSIQGLLTVKSLFFSIHMESIYRTSSSEVNAVVQRDEGGIRIVYWQTK